MGTINIYKKSSYCVIGHLYYPLNSLKISTNTDKSELRFSDLSDINSFYTVLFANIRKENDTSYASFDEFIESLFVLSNMPNNNGEYYEISQPTIDVVHRNIHKGIAFYQNHKRTYSSNNTSDYILKTFDKEIHFGYVIIGSSYQLAMYKIADITTVTEVGFLNRNHNKADLPPGVTNLICRQFRNTDVNINTYTLESIDLINLEVIAAASNRFSIAVGSGEERILKKNSTYLARLTSTANTNIICSRLDFYYE